MNIRALYLGVALSLAFAANANATLIGSTYTFTTSVTGATQISPLGGFASPFTDPANPGFCVGPPLACGSGSGLAGSFAFNQLTPTLDRIVFTFFGSTAGAGPGTFSIALANFATVDGEVITNVTFEAGGLIEGSFTSAFDGTTVTFTGSTTTDYNAIGGRSIGFNVATTVAPPVVPEPATLALLASGLVGLAVRKLRRNRA